MTDTEVQRGLDRVDHDLEMWINKIVSENPTKKNEVVVGGIYTYSWGYDQTNVDFFVVDRRTEKTAWLQPIGSRHVSEGIGWSRVMPDPDRRLDKELIQKRIRTSTLRPDHPEQYFSMDYGCASPWLGSKISENATYWGR